MSTSFHSATSITLSRLRAYERGHKRNHFVVFEVILFAIILGLLLVTLATGVNTYRNISERHWGDEQSRTGLALISNSVHITDTIDAIGVGVGPEGQSLVLTENFASGAYETRIYLYQGQVLEEYARAGSPYAPERATPLIESDSFSFSYAKGLLTVNTRQGSEHIMLHSVRKASVQAAGDAANGDALGAAQNPPSEESPNAEEGGEGDAR